MSLATIVRAVGGDLYDRGRRALIPGPGHSRADRSVSLLEIDGKVVVHSFGRSTWREVLDDLRDRGLVDRTGRPDPDNSRAWPWRSEPAAADRSAAAVRLWREGEPLGRQLSITHVRSRGIVRAAPVSDALRHHPAVPTAVYAQRGRRRPALLAAVTSRSGALCAVEVTYLAPNGGRAVDLRTSRKVVGVLPPGCAVRLDPAGEDLTVGEGVFSTLSGADRFGQPGWALLSARNLRAWSAPTGVRRVLIAGDRGLEGERSARLLGRRLRELELVASIAWPDRPAGDWNEVAMRERRSGGGERVGEGAPSAGMVRPQALDRTP